MRLVLLTIFDGKLNFDFHFILFPQFSSTKELNVNVKLPWKKEKKKTQINICYQVFLNRTIFLDFKTMVNIKKKRLREVILSKAKKNSYLEKQKNCEFICSKYNKN